MPIWLSRSTIPRLLVSVANPIFAHTHVENEPTLVLPALPNPMCDAGSAAPGELPNPTLPWPLPKPTLAFDIAQP